MEDDIRQIAAFNAELVCEAPNNRLAKFEGMMKWKDKTYSIDNEKMLLRGRRLKLILFSSDHRNAWHGTILFQNNETKFKNVFHSETRPPVHHLDYIVAAHPRSHVLTIRQLIRL